MNKCQTLRFDVPLDSKNSENYEISLLDLIKKNKLLEKNEDNGEEIAEMERFVKELEDKYGPVAVVRGKRIRVNDFVDQGNGYDAEDPFIDDSEGEEALIVAPDLMTEHGGFFINKERLRLDDGNFVIDRVEGGNNKMNSPVQKFSKAIGKKTKSQKLLSQARKRLTNSSKNISMRNIIINSEKKLEKVINDVMAVNKPMEVEKIDINIKPIKKTEDIEIPISNLTQEKEANIAQVNNGVVQPVKLLELPTGLPDDVNEKIKSLIIISKDCKPEDLKISAQFNTVLIELDTLLITNQKLIKGIRTAVLRYISQIIEIKYDAILRKICKIKDNKKKTKLKPLFKALEEAIKEAMLESVSKYNHDMEQYNSKIEAQRASQIIQNSDIQGNSMVISTDTESDSKSKSSNKIKLPKRNFKWTITCKSLLFKLICGELEAFRISNNKGSPEEHLNKFYQTNVISLFQPKWMTVSQLTKLSLPLIYEFKQCILNGKEFKTYSPGLKQKSVLKTKILSEPALNGKIVTPTKEPLLIITNCNTTLNGYQNHNIQTSQIKKSLPPSTVSKGPCNNNATTKPQLIVNSIDNHPRVSLKPSFSKSTVRSSSIIPQSRANKNQATMTVKPIEPTKRYSDGFSSGIPSNNTTQSIDLQGFNLIGLPSAPNNDHSLSPLQKYAYPHNNPLDQIRRSASVNPLVNNFVPHCSQKTVLFPHKRFNINEITQHSTNHVQDTILKMHCHTQNVPDISNIFRSPINIAQSIPQSVNKQPTVSQNRVPHIEAIRKSYMPTIKDLSPKSNYHTQGLIRNSKSLYNTQNFLTPPKTTYRPQTFGSPQMIDLTTDSLSDHGQMQSPHYVNMNKAHCTNNRNVNN